MATCLIIIGLLLLRATTLVTAQQPFVTTLESQSFQYEFYMTGLSAICQTMTLECYSTLPPYNVHQSVFINPAGPNFTVSVPAFGWYHMFTDVELRDAFWDFNNGSSFNTYNGQPIYFHRFIAMATYKEGYIYERADAWNPKVTTTPAGPTCFSENAGYRNYTTAAGTQLFANGSPYSLALCNPAILTVVVFVSSPIDQTSFSPTWAFSRSRIENMVYSTPYRVVITYSTMQLLVEVSDCSITQQYLEPGMIPYALNEDFVYSGRKNHAMAGIRTDSAASPVNDYFFVCNPSHVRYNSTHPRIAGRITTDTLDNVLRIDIAPPTVFCV